MTALFQRIVIYLLDSSSQPLDIWCQNLPLWNKKEPMFSFEQNSKNSVLGWLMAHSLLSQNTLFYFPRTDHKVHFCSLTESGKKNITSSHTVRQLLRNLQTPPTVLFIEIKLMTNMWVIHQYLHVPVAYAWWSLQLFKVLLTISTLAKSVICNVTN